MNLCFKSLLLLLATYSISKIVTTCNLHSSCDQFIWRLVAYTHMTKNSLGRLSKYNGGPELDEKVFESNLKKCMTDTGGM